MFRLIGGGFTAAALPLPIEFRKTIGSDFDGGEREPPAITCVALSTLPFYVLSPVDFIIFPLAFVAVVLFEFGCFL